MSAPRPARTVWGASDFVGGVPCLDFVNTAYGRWPGGIAERLHAYDDLVSWSRAARIIDPADARWLVTAARRRRGAARRALLDALGLREALHRVLSAVSRKAKPSRPDVRLLERWILEAQANAVLEIGGSGPRWSWRRRPVSLEAPLWPVARSIAELLVRPDLPRLRCCPGPDCSWLFIDRSKNRARRWCSMATCGNRAKAERHYRRKRTGGP